MFLFFCGVVWGGVVWRGGVYWVGAVEGPTHRDFLNKLLCIICMTVDENPLNSDLVSGFRNSVDVVSWLI